jgi:hypothetical protein
MKNKDKFMPQALINALTKSAESKGIKKGSPRWGAYIYGNPKMIAIRAKEAAAKKQKSKQ